MPKQTGKENNNKHNTNERRRKKDRRRSSRYESVLGNWKRKAQTRQVDRLKKNQSLGTKEAEEMITRHNQKIYKHTHTQNYG